MKTRKRSRQQDEEMIEMVLAFVRMGCRVRMEMNEDLSIERAKENLRRVVGEVQEAERKRQGEWMRRKAKEWLAKRDAESKRGRTAGET